jgi:NADPH:quinone reductase-like Zn-dependent oxidoreductase
MRAVPITRFARPEVLDVVDLPDPTPGEGEQLLEVAGCGVDFADTHRWLSANRRRAQLRGAVAGSGVRR